MSKLAGKIALITGGNSGIGLATAKEFVGEGAYVFITARRATELEKAAKEIGKNVTGVPGDVSKLGDLDRLFARVRQEKGRLDILFANAGIAKYAPLGDITEDFYEEIFSINVKGLLFTVQKALPLLPDGGAIILTSSIVGSKGLAANSIYAATKAVARSFARTWTTDLKHRRIRVNAISPGSINTPGLSNLLQSSQAGEERRKMIAAATPMGRLGTPDEVAKVAVFLEWHRSIQLFLQSPFARQSALLVAPSRRCRLPVSVLWRLTVQLSAPVFIQRKWEPLSWATSCRQAPRRIPPGKRPSMPVYRSQSRHSRSTASAAPVHRPLFPRRRRLRSVTSMLRWRVAWRTWIRRHTSLHELAGAIAWGMARSMTARHEQVSPT